MYIHSWSLAFANSRLWTSKFHWSPQRRLLLLQAKFPSLSVSRKAIRSILMESIKVHSLWTRNCCRYNFVKYFCNEQWHRQIYNFTPRNTFLLCIFFFFIILFCASSILIDTNQNVMMENIKITLMAMMHGRKGSSGRVEKKLSC